MNNESKQMRRFWELSLDILCLVDFDFRFRDVNPACERILGYPKNEVPGRLVTDFVHPDDINATLYEAKLHLHGHVSNHFENRYLCKDGS
jgi:PAS domain S-box-containing protein